MAQRNVILSGIPRGGTTLTCYLANTLADCVALNEPLDASRPLGEDVDENLEIIARFFEAQRHLILTERRANCRSQDRAPITNVLLDKIDKDSGLRSGVVNTDDMVIDKKLDLNFILAAKHPVAFPPMLGALAKTYPCVITIRNPLAVILSWQNIHMNISNGRAPKAEKMQPKLAALLDTISDVHERQIELMSWFFGQFKLVPETSILKYEDLVAQQAAQLPAMIGSSDSLNYVTKSRNLLEQDHEKRDYFAAKLLKQGGHFMDFYTPSEIKALAAGVI